ncbi:hypothetical protein MAR_033802, partial [Mya arenaria]
TEWAAESARKKVRVENSVSLKRPGNKKQYEFNWEVLDLVDSCDKAITLREADRAHQFIKEIKIETKLLELPITPLPGGTLLPNIMIPMMIRGFERLKRKLSRLPLLIMALLGSLLLFEAFEEVEAVDPWLKDVSFSVEQSSVSNAAQRDILPAVVPQTCKEPPTPWVSGVAEELPDRWLQQPPLNRRSSSSQPMADSDYDKYWLLSNENCFTPTDLQTLFSENFENSVDISQHSVKGRLKNCFIFWKDILKADNEILAIIENGYVLPFIIKPPSFIMKNNQSALRNNEFVTSAILDLIGKKMCLRSSFYST